MNTCQRIESFMTKDDGAVTVDFVVLTSAIIGVGLSVMLQVSGGTTALAGATSTEIAAIGAEPEVPESTSVSDGTSNETTRTRRLRDHDDD